MVIQTTTKWLNFHPRYFLNTCKHFFIHQAAATNTGTELVTFLPALCTQLNMWGQGQAKKEEKQEYRKKKHAKTYKTQGSL